MKELLKKVENLYSEYENVNYEYSLNVSGGDAGKALDILEQKRKDDLENIIDPFIDEHRPLIEDEDLEECEWEKDFDLTTDEVLKALNEKQLKAYINYLEGNLELKKEFLHNEE